MIDRRAFLLAIVLAAGCGKSDTPKVASAPEAGAPRVEQAAARTVGAVPRVAMLIFGSRDNNSASGVLAVALFRERMSALGYVEGRTVVVEESYADGDPRRLEQLARSIAASKPDVIVAIAAAATAAARDATATIPIVMAHAGNPVGSGLVASLARPGGNVTGTTSMVPELGVKQVELLRELIPRLAKLGVIANSTNAGMPPLLANVKEAARRFNIEVIVGDVTRNEDFDRAFGVLRDGRPDALLVMMEPLIGMNRGRILDFAAANRLPASFDVGREAAREGALISYGPVLTTHYAHAADYVDKILKGANPGELPVQQPTEFALVINLKTANALGIAVPQSLRVRANEVIE